MKKEVEIVNKRTGGVKVTFGIASAVLALYCLTLIYPFIWMFQTSLKTSLEYFTSGTLDFAVEPQWQNYIEVFDKLKVKEANFIIMLWNTVWHTFGSSTIGIFASCVVAYCLSKYKFGARNFMYAVIIFIMVYPSMGTSGASYKQAQDLGIFDTPLLLIKSAGGYSGKPFFVLYSFFVTLPWDYGDAALIDGANDFQVFFKIMIPMAMGPIMAMYTVDVIGGWNDYMNILLYLPSYPTLMAGLYLYESDMTRAVNYPLYYTGLIVSIIPVLIAFACCQDLIMKNVTMGGLKG